MEIVGSSSVFGKGNAEAAAREPTKDRAARGTAVPASTGPSYHTLRGF
jgi:hypothetical protein